MNKNPKTIEDLEAIPGEILTVAQVASVIGGDPVTIRLQARQRPDLLGFPAIVYGTRVKIPKRPFLNFLREGASG